MFTFQTETETSRERRKMEVVRLPPCVAPKTEVKVDIVIHRGIIKMPFTARFTSGNSKWWLLGKLDENLMNVYREIGGLYTGEDATQIKLEFAEVWLSMSNYDLNSLYLGHPKHWKNIWFNCLLSVIFTLLRWVCWRVTGKCPECEERKWVTLPACSKFLEIVIIINTFTFLYLIFIS